MNVYVFEDIEYLTDNYHSGGGLVVIAKNSKHVEEMINRENDESAENIHLTDEEWANVVKYPTDEGAEPRIFVFPDAGCC